MKIMMIQIQQDEDDDAGFYYYEVGSNRGRLDDTDASDADSNDSDDIDNDETDDDLGTHVGTDPVLHW